MSISVCSRLIRYSLMEKLVCSNQWNISEFLRPKIIVKLDFTTSNIRNELFSRWDLDLPYQCHLYTEWHPVKLLRQIHINEVNSFCVHGNVSCVKKTLCKITHVLIWYNGGNVWYEESFMYAQLFEEETCTL